MKKQEYIKIRRQYCPWCGRRMRELHDSKIESYAKSLWRCELCLPEDMNICVG